MFKVFKQFSGLRKENYILFIGKLVTSLGSFVWPMLTFFMTTKLGISDSNSTLILSISTLVHLPGALFGGKIADKLNKKWNIVVLDFISVGLYIMSAILPFRFYTVIFILIAGLCQNIESPSYDALIADFSDSSQREKAFSLNYLGGNLGFVVGASISGLLFAKHTSLAFILNGFAIAISTMLILIFINSKHTINCVEDEEITNTIYEERIDDNTHVLHLVSVRKPLLIMLFVMMFSWVPSQIESILLPLQLKTDLGLYGSTLYGYLCSLNGLTVILLTPVFSYLTTKISEIVKTGFGIIFYVLGMVIFMLTKSPILLFIGMFIFTLGEISLVVGSSPYLSRRVPINYRGRISGLSTAVSTIFSSLFQFGLSILLSVTSNNYFIGWISFIIFDSIVAIICFLQQKIDKKSFPLLYK